MALPAINFGQIAKTAKDALSTYGTPAQFFEGNATTSRPIKVVIYKDEKAESLLADVDSKPATAILNPDDFAAPYRLPKKFDKIVIDVAGFVRTYTVESAHPILAQETLPLILVQLKAN
jgi:hypothetical protein